MKFSTREDVDAPIATVWDKVTDTENFERIARKRGIQVEKTSPDQGLAVGSAWAAQFDYHGLRRTLTLCVETCDAPHLFVMSSHSGGIDGTLTITLDEKHATRTNMALSLELVPGSVSGRVLIQTLRLAKATLDKRFKNRIKRFARDLK